MKDTAPLWHTSKPDVDNMAKFLMDSLNKIYWKDDSYIADCWITKQYDDKPRTEIDITLL
jgi:Holliday junction resolvase RusA-like endonuclease